MKKKKKAKARKRTPGRGATPAIGSAPEVGSHAPGPQRSRRVVERAQYDVAEPMSVTIFGAGVSGLTAAHELVERGFKVQVWEPADNPRFPDRGCDVGGMARTQWARVPWLERASAATPGDVRARSVPGEMQRATPIVHLPQKFYYRETVGKEQAMIALGRFGETDPKRVAAELIQDLREHEGIGHVYCEVFSRDLGIDVKAGEDPARALTLGVIDKIEQAGLPVKALPTDQGDENLEDYRYEQDFEIDGKPLRVTFVYMDVFPEGLPSKVKCRAQFRVRERWLPGEHGFRFFPGFYHHLFDTMRRTPILEPVEKSDIGQAQERAMAVNAEPTKYTETGRTAFDNIQSTRLQVFGFPGAKVKNGAGHKETFVSFERSLPRSLEELRRWVKILFQDGSNGEPGFGYSLRDVLRFQLRFLQYLTSSSARRREYENMTWLEFLGEDYSEPFIDVLKRWPQALVAMSAEEADARTFGSVQVQLLAENFLPEGYRDGTLNGPTSEAWFSHWRRYLEGQGVEFIHGMITGFRKAKTPDGRDVIWPTVRCFEPRYGLIDSPDGEPPLMPGYFVLALPALQAQEIAQSYFNAVGSDDYESRAREEWSDLRRLTELSLSVAPPLSQKTPVSPPVGRRPPTRLASGEGAGQSARRAATANETGNSSPQLRHMVGIQFYFEDNPLAFDGHLYFPKSPWGLTAISQERFWQDRADWEHGYRGIVSVCFAALDVAGTNRLTVWQSTEDEIAHEVWAQITDSVGRPLPNPSYWHLDQTFRRTGGTSRRAAGSSVRADLPYTNESPLQVNLPGRWEERPGELRKHDDPTADGYTVENGIVLAGTYMKTYTRLTTMEAANESARHAVNAILSDLERRTYKPKSHCEVHPLEEREFEDLNFWKEVDELLYKAGEDHCFEILDLDDLVAHGLRGGRRDPFDPLWILGEVSRHLSHYGGGLVTTLLGLIENRQTEHP